MVTSMSMLLLLSVLAVSTPSTEVAATLSEVTAVAAAAVPGTEVLSTRDIEKIVALESQKQLVGCAATDCLAEVAGALGARLVVFGELGALDDQLVLTLNVYDAEAARSVGRQLVRGAGAAALSEAIPAAVSTLLQAPVASVTSRPVRVLVMKIEGATTAPAEVLAPVPAENAWLGTAGLVTVGVGGALAVGGGVLGLLASGSQDAAANPTTTQKAAKDLYDARNAQALGANILFASGAVVAAGGATLWLLGME